MDKSKFNDFKGITLINLVVAIIVLLILAGIAVTMVAGNTGVLVKTTDAKKLNERGSERENVDLSKQEALISGYNKQSGMSKEDVFKELNINAKLKNKFKEKYINNVAKVVDGVPIPTKFAYVEGTHKDDGLIVTDEYGNEYVWVPASSETGWSAPGINPNQNSITDNIDDEYAKMIQSIELYRGFYVGRYETSWNGTQVASVGNVYPMSGDTKIDGISFSDWYTFYKESKKLHNDSVVSSMIYNSQWQAIMAWMNNITNPNVSGNILYTDDSTGMGNFRGEIEKTGSNENYKVKNIYDLAGNMYEWTQKANSQGTGRAVRGNYSKNDNATFKASNGAYRNSSDTAIYCGSRLALYININD